MASSTTGTPLHTETIQRLVTRAVQDDPRILAVYLFGSRTKGEEHPASDVDLAVLFEDPHGLGELVALEGRIGDALGTPVDLIDLSKANAFLALDAVRGERIFCADSTRCDEFDLYVLRRAGDLEFVMRNKPAGFSEDGVGNLTA